MADKGMRGGAVMAVSWLPLRARIVAVRGVLSLERVRSGHAGHRNSRDRVGLLAAARELRG